MTKGTTEIQDKSAF